MKDGGVSQLRNENLPRQIAPTVSHKKGIPTVKRGILFL